MRTFRVLVVAVLMAGGLVVLAPGATASAPAASKQLVKFCKAANKISGNTPSGGESAAGKKLAKTTRNAAKLAPTSRVRNALNDMADYFEAIGNAGSNPEKVAAALKLSAKYAKAAAIFTGYLIGHCSTIST